jgi:hypothetical protein
MLTRARIRAVAGTTRDAIDSAVAGSVAMTEIGDDDAPMIVVQVMLTEDDTLADVTSKVESAITTAPDAFVGRGLEELRQIAFNTLKQGAIHDLFVTRLDVRDVPSRARDRRRGVVDARRRRSRDRCRRRHRRARRASTRRVRPGRDPGRRRHRRTAARSRCLVPLLSGQISGSAPRRC